MDGCFVSRLLLRGRGKLVVVIEYERPIFGDDVALLRGRSGDVTHDVHASSGGTRARHKFRPTQGLVARGRGNVSVRIHFEVAETVGKDGLQKDKEAVRFAAHLVDGPTHRTVIRETN